MKQNKHSAELSYYGLYLQKFIIENHPDKASDTDFITVRDELAADTFEQARRVGYPVAEAHELAMQALLQGLHFSEFRAIEDVLENEFSDTVQPEKIRPLALSLLSRMKDVFAGYPLTDDFVQSSDYNSLYTELTGAIAIYIEEYGI